MLSKKTPISELKPGQLVDDIFVVKIKRDMRPYSRGHSFRLILSDASGRSLEYVFWGGTDEDVVRGLHESVSEDDVIRISGKVGKYRGSLQISANPEDVFSVLQEGDYNSKEFIAQPRRDPDEMFEDIMEAVRSVQNVHLRRLLEDIFGDPELVEDYKTKAGGISIHHSTYAGLLEHNWEVLKYALLSVELFDLDRDLIVTGALLHDIGKVEEMTITTRIKGTRRGQLLGHISLGLGILSRRMDRLKTPQKIREKVLHMLVSHHGRNEYGSPKEPMFPEAVAVAQADLASSRINELETFISRVESNTESEFAYYKRGGRNILLDSE